MKKLLLVGVLMSSTILKADWVDDLAQLMRGKSELDVQQSILIAQEYVAKDKVELERAEKNKNAQTDTGFWASARGMTYYAEVLSAKKELRYHEKILRFILELPVNKRDKTKLEQDLITLNTLVDELQQLKEDAKGARGFGEKIKMKSKIAYQESQIWGRKSLIKMPFIT